MPFSDPFNKYKEIATSKPLYIIYWLQWHELNERYRGNPNNKNEREIIGNIQEAYGEFNKNGKRVIFTWVPFHQGQRGNIPSSEWYCVWKSCHLTARNRKRRMKQNIDQVKRYEKSRHCRELLTTKVHPQYNWKGKSNCDRLTAGCCKIIPQHLLEKTELTFYSLRNQTLTTNYYCSSVKNTKTKERNTNCTHHATSMSQAHVTSSLKFLEDSKLYQEICIISNLRSG